MPLPTLSPWRRAGSTDDATSYTPIPPTPPDGNPTPTQPTGTLRQSGQPNTQTHEISTGSGLISVSHDSGDSPREPSRDESHALSASDIADISSPLPSVHGMYTVHAGNQALVPTPHVLLEESVFKTVGRIDEAAEVAQFVISSPSTHHTSILGAHASRYKTRGLGFCSIHPIVR